MKRVAMLIALTQVMSFSVSAQETQTATDVVNAVLNNSLQKYLVQTEISENEINQIKAAKINGSKLDQVTKNCLNTSIDASSVASYTMAASFLYVKGEEVTRDLGAIKELDMNEQSSLSWIKNSVEQRQNEFSWSVSELEKSKKDFKKKIAVCSKKS